MENEKILTKHFTKVRLLSSCPRFQPDCWPSIRGPIFALSSGVGTDKFLQLAIFLNACQGIVVSVNPNISVMTFQESGFCLYLTQKLLGHL